MARLCTGHSMLLRAYRHRIGQELGTTCLECGQSDETLDHLLTDYPARAFLRRDVFGREDPNIREALEDSHILIAFLRRLVRLP